MLLRGRADLEEKAAACELPKSTAPVERKPKVTAPGKHEPTKDTAASRRAAARKADADYLARMRAEIEEGEIPTDESADDEDLDVKPSTSEDKDEDE